MKSYVNKRLDQSMKLLPHIIIFSVACGVLVFFPAVASAKIIMSTDTVLSSDIVGDELEINASNVTLDCDGHTVRGNGPEFAKYGISILPGINNVTIKNCIIGSYYTGVIIYRGRGNSLENNTFINNARSIYINSYSANNKIVDNIIKDSSLLAGLPAIEIYFLSTSTSIINNTITNNYVGIQLTGTSNNRISENVISQNSVGINSVVFNNSTISNNNIFDNYTGLAFNNSNNNKIYDNKFIKQQRAIQFSSDSNQNHFFNNLITENYFGLWSPSSYFPADNYFYKNNIFANTFNIASNLAYSTELSYQKEGNYWGHVTAPCFHRAGSQNYPEDSNNPAFIDSYPFCQKDAWVTHQNFWSPLQNSPQGWLNLRKTPGTLNKPTDNVIKTVPNDWVLKVATTTDATGNPIEMDGYQWYGVVDSADNALGWMTAKELSTGTTYLSYDANAQVSLEAKVGVQLSTKEARIPIILRSVDAYYVATTSNSLYAGGGGYDGLNNFQRFIQGASYPKELVLAIAGHESAGTLDNEICSSARDGGIGVMQITSTGFKGLGSALKNYPKMGDCRTNSSTSTYYSNVFQGIYANIKDGLRVLQEKYRKKCPDAGLTIGTLVYSCQDIERVLTTWGYNGKVLTGNYLKQISNSLRDLSTYFPGISYANNDQLIEKLAMANSHRIEFKKFSPVEIEAIDSEGRITGFDGEEIPFSAYDKESDGGVIFFPQNQNQYVYRVIGTGTGTYDFKVESTENDVLHTVSAANIPVIPNEVYEYSINWDVLLRGERGVTVKIDENGDGTFERIVKSDGTLTEVVPPTVSITSPSGEYLLNATSIAQFTATDDSGIATVNATLNNIPVTNGQSLTLTRPGKNILDVSAMDNEGNTATATSIFSVVYNIKGFLAPLKNNEIGVNREKTIPIKFKLYDVKGKLVSKARANLYIAKITDGVVGVDEIPRSNNDKDDKKDDRKSMNQFRYDSEEQLYILNLSTKQMTRGTWQIKAVLDSGQEIVGRVVIR